MGNLYQIEVPTIQGEITDLSKYRGKVLLIVNVASQCGFTPQYQDLRKLHENYHARGLRILAFPCNDFLGQEPGDNREILEFCEREYGVEFDVFGKIRILGEDCHPLYRFLQAAGLKAKTPSSIKSWVFKFFKLALKFFKGTGSSKPENVQWNFHKFIVGKEGSPVAHFSSAAPPLDPMVTAQIERALKGEGV